MKALVVGILGLVFLGGTGANSTQSDVLGEERFLYLDLFDQYVCRIKDVIQKAQPISTEIKRLNKLIKSLEEAKCTLINREGNEEYEKKQAAIGQLLTQYKEESVKLNQALSVNYNKEQCAEYVKLMNESWDRYIELTEQIKEQYQK